MSEVFVAPAGTLPDEDGWAKLGEAMGLTADELAQFTEALEGFDLSPKGELKHRLNLSVQGVDPGPSVNWKGERGFRV